MFLDEGAFDNDDVDTGFNKMKVSNSRPTTGSMTTRDNSRRDDDEEDGGGFGSAGALAPQASSRARMLAQQREIQLKRRAAQMQSAGMVRSSQDNDSPYGRDGGNQFTPAPPQFSAPKASSSRNLGANTENDRSTSEFSRPARPVVSSPNRDNRDKDYDDRDRRDDRDRDRRPKGGKSRQYYEDSEEEEQEDRDRDRRGARDRDRDRDRGSRNKPRYEEEEVDYDDRDRDRGGRDRERDRDGPRRSKPDYDDGDRDDRRARDRRDEGRDRDTRDRGGGGWEGTRGGKQPSQERREDRREERRRTDDRDRDPRREETAAAPPAVSNSNNQDQPPVIIPTVAINLTNMRAFLSSPAPKGAGVLQCYIRRNKSGTNKFNPVYTLYLKDGDRLLLQSKKRANNKTSNYLITMAENDFNRDSMNYLGKLRSNFVGTEFNVYDNGAAPKGIKGEELEETGGSNMSPRKELAGIMYAANVMGSRGPRKMQVAVPVVDEDQDRGARAVGSNSQVDELVNRIKDRNMRDIVYMINKPPRWNEQVAAYVLNFNGRVTMASVKNFQLVDPDEQSAVLLQFGRVGKDEFTMDFQWPLSPLQAFGITLSSFDSKIACD